MTWNSKSLSTVFRESKKMKDSYLAEVFRVGYVELGRLTKSSDREAAVNPLDLEPQIAWIDNMERALRSAVSGEVQRLEKTLSLLATTGNAAPFIGLFGTVWGIMVAFQGIGLKGSATQVRKIFSPERAKGEILGDGISKPEEAAQLLLGKLVEKDLVYF